MRMDAVVAVLQEPGSSLGCATPGSCLGTPTRIELRVGPAGDQRWRDRAACLGMDTLLFFHNVGASVHVKESLKICNGDGTRPPCPVRAECGEYALSFPKEDDIAGVFGGMTPAERHKIRKQRRQDGRKLAVTAERALAGGDAFTYQLALLLNLIHDAVMFDGNGQLRPE